MNNRAMKLYLSFKRGLDFICALALLIVTSPIMILAALAIKCESRGPVLFKQQRPGKNSRIFTLFKFRTMRPETCHDGRQLSDMERMTKVGSFLRKTSIDELPQLFNIIRGQMSFIGPRPLLVKYLPRYTPQQMRRHDITPGISGWAQVNGRNALTWDQKFAFDVWYVDNVSFTLDLKILFLTVLNILTSKGVNSSNDATMPEFRGTCPDDSD